jgi:hypothetical protein
MTVMPRNVGLLYEDVLGLYELGRPARNRDEIDIQHFASASHTEHGTKLRQLGLVYGKSRGAEEIFAADEAF